MFTLVVTLLKVHVRLVLIHVPRYDTTHTFLMRPMIAPQVPSQRKEASEGLVKFLSRTEYRGRKGPSPQFGMGDKSFMKT